MNSRKDSDTKTSNRFFVGAAVGFTAGVAAGVITEFPLSNLIKIFSDSGDTAGLMFFKFLVFGFFGMILGGFFGMLKRKNARMNKIN